MHKNRVVLITGASSGIGRATAIEFARDGARLVISDLNEQAGEAVKDLIVAEGGQAVFMAADVGKPDDSKALVEYAVAQFGRLDVACNNAGIGGVSAATADYPLDEWALVLNVNLSGVFYGMQQQIRAMLGTGGGAIINVASILGAVALANSPAYTAAKHGVVGLTQAAALEYGGKNIRINAVAPGFIVTPMISNLQKDTTASAMLAAAHALGRLGRPEEAAAMIVWLASDKASFVTGAYLPVDGGYLAR